MRSHEFEAGLQALLQNCMMWVGQSDQCKTLSHVPLESVGETPNFIKKNRVIYYLLSLLNQTIKNI